MKLKIIIIIRVLFISLKNFYHSINNLLYLNWTWTWKLLNRFVKFVSRYRSRRRNGDREDVQCERWSEWRGMGAGRRIRSRGGRLISECAFPLDTRASVRRAAGSTTGRHFAFFCVSSTAACHSSRLASRCTLDTESILTLCLVIYVSHPVRILARQPSLTFPKFMFTRKDR